MPDSQSHSSNVSHWLGAMRLKTLPLALVSIITGSTLAAFSGQFTISISVMALLTATLLQILSNLANDYGDAIKGTDNDNRIGPTRAIQSGAISAKQMKVAMIVTVVLSLVSGISLIAIALNTFTDAIVFFGLGVLAIISAIAYTVGNKPYGYIGLGDVSVLIFFGLLGVGGTYYLHHPEFVWTIGLPSLASGLLSVAVLNVNNMRDIENDKECGKYTVPVRIGLPKAKKYHLSLLLTAWLCFSGFLYHFTNLPSTMVFAVCSAIPLTLHIRGINAASSSKEMAPKMGGVVKCAIFCNILFCLTLYFS
jgi:1,4-dihydroxy-2-naphthoate octaprenyltransferase